MRSKLGLVREEADDLALASDLLERLAANQVDYTLFFRRLCASAADPAADEAIASSFAEPGAFRDWAESWRRRLASEDIAPDERARTMRLANPAFIPRNHRIEEAIEAAVRRADFEPFETLTRGLERPYDDQPELAYLAEPLLPEERVRHTFCGT